MDELLEEYAAREAAALGYPRPELRRKTGGGLRLLVDLDNEALASLAERLGAREVERERALDEALRRPLRAFCGEGRPLLQAPRMAAAAREALDGLLAAIEADLERLAWRIEEDAVRLEGALDPEAIIPGGILLSHAEGGFRSRVVLVREPRFPVAVFGDRTGELLGELAQGRAVRYAMRAEVQDNEGAAVGSAVISGVHDTPELAEGRRLAKLLLLTAAEVWRERRAARA